MKKKPMGRMGKKGSERQGRGKDGGRTGGEVKKRCETYSLVFTPCPPSPQLQSRHPKDSDI